MWDSHLIEDEVSVCQQRNIIDYLFRYLPKDELILEAGCGLGAWVIYLRENGYNIEGIDHDEKVISRLKEYDPTLPLKSGGILNLPYPDNSLGGYISLGVLEHFKDGTKRPLEEAMRVLKPGGIMIFTVPFNSLFRRIIAHPLRALYLFIHRLRGGRAFFAEYRYSTAEAQRVLEKAGFQIVATDVDDFIDKTRSLALWSEFPFFQDQHKPYALNLSGRILAYIMNSISRRIAAAGVLVVARKPLIKERP
jgi:SAM-dependent methyltransferase